MAKTLKGHAQGRQLLGNPLSGYNGSGCVRAFQPLGTAPPVAPATPPSEWIRSSGRRRRDSAETPAAGRTGHGPRECRGAEIDRDGRAWKRTDSESSTRWGGTRTRRGTGRRPPGRAGGLRGRTLGGPAGSWRGESARQRVRGAGGALRGRWIAGRGSPAGPSGVGGQPGYPGHRSPDTLALRRARRGTAKSVTCQFVVTARNSSASVSP